MTRHRLDLAVLDDRLAVCRLGGGEPLPGWATLGDFSSVTRTPEELSIVCPESIVPEGVRAERGWRALRVVGTMDLSLVGVLASLVAPLAEAGVGLFAVSTFDTDYLLVRGRDLGRAIDALAASGHHWLVPSLLEGTGGRGGQIKSGRVATILEEESP